MADDAIIRVIVEGDSEGDDSPEPSRRERKTERSDTGLIDRFAESIRGLTTTAIEAVAAIKKSFASPFAPASSTAATPPVVQNATGPMVSHLTPSPQQSNAAATPQTGGQTPAQVAQAQISAAKALAGVATAQAQAQANQQVIQAQTQAGVAAAQAKGQAAQAQAQAAAAKAQAQVAAAQAQAQAAQARAQAAQLQAAARTQAAQAQAAAAQLVAQAKVQTAQAQAQAASLKAQTAQANLTKATAQSQAAQARASRTMAKMGPDDSFLDQLLKVIGQFRGTLGGIFGTVVGAGLDIITATAKAAKQQAGTNLPDLNLPIGSQLPSNYTWMRQPTAATPAQPWTMGPSGQWQPPTPQQSAQPGTAVPMQQWKVLPTAGTPSQPATAGTPFQPPVPMPSGWGVPPTPPTAGIAAQPAVAGMAPTPGVPQSGMGVMAGAGIAAAAFAAGAAVMKAMDDSAAAASKFAATMISADSSVTSFVGNVGASIKSFGDSIPILGANIALLGTAIQGVSAVMQQLDGMVDRYQQFSPELAMGQGMADIRQQLGDFRRGQEGGPAMLQYMQARTELQQKVEDMKIRLLTQMAPTVMRGMEAFEKAMPFIEGIVTILTGLANAVFDMMGIQRQTNTQLGTLESMLADLNRPGGLEIPTSIIRQGYPFSHTAMESTRPVTG